MENQNKNSTIEDIELLHEPYFNTLRQTEYKRLDDEGQVYLDYTGGNLYGTSQLNKHFEILQKHTFGNPHSTNPTSQWSSEMLDRAREDVIKFFNAEDYFCIFTQNASMALQIVGENYPFEDDGHYLYCIDNHNSVNGIREYCKGNGGSHDHFSLNLEDLTLAHDEIILKLGESKCRNKLLAYPAQSNVSGIKHDLGYIKIAHELGWDVLLDAAAYIPTSSLDLKLYQPDFVSVSFYKLFGYPTGIGCLLVKKTTFSKLRKRWFAGGTVNLASAKAPFHYLTQNHERFENGTVNYLGIPAITIGLEYIKSIGMQRLNERVDSLSKYLYYQLLPLKHTNGTNQVEIFGPKDRINCGSSLLMTFNNPNETKVPFETIEHRANLKNISVRSGCFCNPGLDETTNCISTQELTTYFTNQNNGNYYDMMKQLQKMRGAIRVSVGLATTKKDLNVFVDFVQELKDQIITN